MMLSSLLLLVLIGSTSLIEGAVVGTSQQRRDLGSRVLKRAENTCIAANALQTGSFQTGQEPGTAGIKPGQSPSAVDNANFVNFCSGQTLTNGKQIITGSCNGIPMGKLPAKTNMISAMITNPNPGDKIPAGTTFNISVQTAHLNAGFFVNPTTNYYTAPQDLDENGDIIGHCHVTVQSIGTSLKSLTPPDPTTFAFFKGIDDNGNGKGLLQAVVTGGLPAGFYRVCTMIAARNHQPVNMPIAQRGAQDDCTKFEVVGQGGNASAGSGAKGDPNMGSVTTDAPIAKSTQKSGSGNKGNNGNTKATSVSAISSASPPAKSATQKAKGVAGGKGKSSAVASATSSTAVVATPPAGKASSSKINGGNNGKGVAASPSPTTGASRVKSGTLGGAPPAVENSNADPRRPYAVEGNTFDQLSGAVQRACDIQFNRCADAVNGGQLKWNTIWDCQKQKNWCGPA